MSSCCTSRASTGSRCGRRRCSIATTTSRARYASPRTRRRCCAIWRASAGTTGGGATPRARCLVVHAVPGVWAPVVATARTHGVPFVRVPVEHGTGRGLVKRWTIAAAWRVAARGLPAPRHADRFYGIGLQDDARFSDRLLAPIDRLPAPGITELMVHPGRPDAALAAWDGYVAARAAGLA